MTSLAPSTKSREEVATAARDVYAFLVDPTSALRRFALAASDGGAHYASSVWARTGEAYISRRKLQEDSETVGVSVEHFVTVAQSRLCQ